MKPRMLTSPGAQIPRTLASATCPARVNRYNPSVDSCKLKTMVLLSAVQCLGTTVFAKNQGVGRISGNAGEDPAPAGAYPLYRVEVLAFAYNDFDPDEEIFADEPFVIRLDTRRPKLLITPGTPPPDSLMSDVVPDLDRLDAPLESFDPAPAAPVPSDAGRIAGAATGGAVGELPPDLAVLDGEVGPPQEAGPPEDVGPPEELRPATAASISVVSALGQRIIASLTLLEDPSTVPVVYDPIPFDPPLPDSALAGPATDEPALEGTAEPPERDSLTPDSPFRVLRSDELELHGALQRLQRGDAYTPLVHGGWIQAAYPPEQAIPFDVSSLATVNPVGTVQLHLSRFLHVTVDLVYRAQPEPRSVQAPTDGTVVDVLNLPSRYALRIQRRVRSEEIHYIDHPAFGLIVVVKPQPEEAAEDEDPLGPPRGPAA